MRRGQNHPLFLGFVLGQPLSAPVRPELPEYLKARVAADKPGRGVSDKPEDATYPYLLVLQNNSRVCQVRSPDYVQGAEPGKFYLRSLPNPVHDGEKGIVVVIWTCEEGYKEWKKGQTFARGGFVGSHLVRPADARLDPDDEYRTIRANGNELVRTKQVFLLFEGLPYELPLKGTGLGLFRDLTTHFKFYTDDKGRTLPCYTRRYRLRTKPMSNAQGNWFGIVFDDLGWVDGATYDTSRRLAEALEDTLRQQRELIKAQPVKTIEAKPVKIAIDDEIPV
jgi:hypothetical protein